MIRIELTDGDVRNGHFYLRRHLDFFPGDAVGPANGADGTGNRLQVLLVLVVRRGERRYDVLPA